MGPSPRACWQRALHDTVGFRAWRREVVAAIITALTSFIVLRRISSAQSATDQVISIAVSVTIVLALIPLTELIWNRIKAPARILLDENVRLRDQEIESQFEIGKLTGDLHASETERARAEEHERQLMGRLGPYVLDNAKASELQRALGEIGRHKVLIMYLEPYYAGAGPLATQLMKIFHEAGWNASLLPVRDGYERQFGVAVRIEAYIRPTQEAVRIALHRVGIPVGTTGGDVGDRVELIVGHM